MTTIAITCDHRGRVSASDETRIVCRLELVPRVTADGIPLDYEPLWREVEGDATQYYGDELVQLMDGQDLAGQLRTFDDRDRILKGMSARRWRFHCPDCRLTVPATSGKVDAVCSRMHAGGASSIDMTDLQRILGG